MLLVAAMAINGHASTASAIGYFRSAEVSRSKAARVFCAPLDKENYAASASSFEFSKGK